MIVKCNYKVTYEQETHDRVNQVLGRVTSDEAEVQMVTALNQIIHGFGIWAMTFNIPKIVLEINPEESYYPVYNTLHREVRINNEIQNVVAPNKSEIQVLIIPPDVEPSEIKLPEIPFIPKQEESSND